MNATNLLQRLHQHRLWATHNLLESAGRLSPEQLRQTFPIGQGSVWKSLLHMYAAEYVWLETLRGDASAVCPGDLPGRLPGNQAGTDPVETLPELLGRWKLLDVAWQDWLNQQTDSSLSTVVHRVSTSSSAGQGFDHSISDVVLHVCLHAHQTATQVVNMLRHLGVTPLPDTMLIVLARSEADPTKTARPKPG